jgi:spermidine/putrescine transport system substrate-binding protein
MVFHPREGRSSRLLTRRDFLWRSAALGVSLPTLSAILAACGNGGGSSAAEVVIGTPASPATQPLYDDNPAIASGVAAESGPLQIYNWEQYINPDTIVAAEEALGVSIVVNTFFNEEEALQKLTAGVVRYDVWFPTAPSIPKVVAGKVLQPINLDYIPNLSNVWPQLANPFYDRGSRYTVPYAVYQTGIAWRADLVDDADVLEIDNPWDVLWNSKYQGITGLYDDFRETLAVALFRNGVADPTVATSGEISAAADSLIELVDLMNIRYTIDGTYAGIPEGRFGLHEAWSGDVVASPYYFPEGEDPSVMRYHWPVRSAGSARGYIANDTISILKGAEHPVLAHQFLNFMLDEANALENFGWNGYQPPQRGLDVGLLVADEWVPPYLASAVVLPEDFENPRGVVPIQITAEQEGLLLDAWARVQAGG